ncbi:MAG: polysaccharide biosynthesis protein, partial [Nitrospirae bacterium]
LYSPVGFIDDNSTKRGAIIQGVRVLGTVGDIESVAETENVEEVVIAIAGIDGEKLRMLVKRCRQRGIVCRILPSFSRLLEMDHEMRDIELSDLMRRAPKDLDIAEIQKYVCGKNVLVTGAAGSIGSEIVRQCLRFSPNVIAAVDQSEFGLYSLKEELGHESVKYVLGDVKQEEFVDCLMKCHRPDIIFHAAAYKHVPLLEENVSEAIRNNIGCTKIMAFAADKYNVKSFVLISTDKAVKPSSIMGATKRICELLIQNFNRLSNTEFVAVRFGNVLGSSGSVVPKFMQQIKSGKPVTVTHPDATRYFMLIDEAVQLVLQAAAIGRGGEIFILDMGMP